MWKIAFHYSQSDVLNWVCEIYTVMFSTHGSMQLMALKLSELEWHRFYIGMAESYMHGVSVCIFREGVGVF